MSRISDFFKSPTTRAVNENRELRGQLQAMASVVDWERVERTFFSDSTGDTGNDYLGYPEATKELAKKYDGRADWGNQIAQILVDVRAAATVGAGLNFTIPKENQKEADAVDRIVDHNGLDAETLTTFASDGEIDGKMLIRLVKDMGTDGRPVVGIRLIPYNEIPYKVAVDGADYKKVVGITYSIKDGQEVRLSDPAEFVFFKLAGRTTKVNETRSKCAKLLMEMENLDRGLKDFRKINHLFAHPTPWAKTETIEEAQALVDYIAEKKWKVGKFMAGTAEFEYKSADMKGAESIVKEIVTLVQIISGGTGVPPHFLGFPELMSNRATAEALVEMIVMATEKERKAHIGGWGEVFYKSLVMQGTLDNESYDPTVVSIDIPFTSTEALTEAVEGWLPLRDGRHISADTFLSKIPGINPEEEKEKLESEEKGDSDKFVDTNKDRLRKEIADQMAEAAKAKEEGAVQ